MANIALDLGNSFAKAGFFKGEQLKETKTLRAKTFDALLDYVKAKKPNAVIMASVVHVPADFLKSLKALTTVWQLNESIDLPITINYEKPDQLGKDRIASAAAVPKIYPQSNVLSIDLGSCVTYDFVNSSGVFEGGGISPGFQMRLKAMSHFTENLPLLGQKELITIELIGRNTEDCMLSGTVNGLLKEVDGIIDAYKQQVKPLKVIIGGGDAPFFENNLKNTIFAEPELVLKGLNQILQFNAQ